MIPKQNAKELIEAMAISISYGYNYTGGDDIPIYRNQYAKECALIAVEEKNKFKILINKNEKNKYIHSNYTNGERSNNNRSEKSVRTNLWLG